METKHEFTKVMHPLKQRRLQVSKVERPTPKVARLTFRDESSADVLADFTTLSPDDHVKVFFPYPGEIEPALPGGERPPLMRDYTPIFNKDKRELQFDFCLHGNGVGSNWAANAKVGDSLTIGGPKGSQVVPNDFDGYVLIGDETGLPSIRRRLQELPADAKTLVVVEVASSQERQHLEKQNTQIHWVYRKDGAATLLETVLGLSFPSGEVFASVACEKKQAFAIRDMLVNEKKLNEKWIKAKGYWTRGEEGF